ncbi:MAG: hypothetical protein ACOZNI_37615 [Myxococcota bacterium]
MFLLACAVPEPKAETGEVADTEVEDTGVGDTGEAPAPPCPAVLEGERGDYAGWTLASGGDVTGDGVDDVAVSSAYSRDFGSGVYVVAGPVTGSGLLGDVATATWISEHEDDRLGASVTIGADLDGDGVGDAILGAPYFPDTAQGTGAVYVVYGGPGLGDMSAERADVWLTGTERYEYVGFAVAAGADLDGDGIADLLTISGGPGVVWFVPGGGLPGAANLSDVSGSEIRAAEGRGAPGAVAFAGDLDGDGAEDVILGAPADGAEGEASASPGAVYFLRSADVVAGAALDETTARLVGSSSDELLGSSLSRAGDTDGDGSAEVVLGRAIAGKQAESDVADPVRGGAWLVEGMPEGVQSVADVGTELLGEGADELFGEAVHGGADLDGDGLDDAFAGATGYSPDAGRVYGFFGGTRALLEGVPGDGAGTAVASASWGGADTLLVGAGWQWEGGVVYVCGPEAFGP